LACYAAGLAKDWLYSELGRDIVLTDSNKYYFDQTCRLKAIEAADLFGFDLRKLVFEVTEGEQIPDKTIKIAFFAVTPGAVLKRLLMTTVHVMRCWNVCSG
jgi:hypothetical protein